MGNGRGDKNMANIVVDMEVVIPEKQYDSFLEKLENENSELKAYVVDNRDIIVARVIIRKGPQE